MARHASPRSVGRIRDLVRSWDLYLRAINSSPRTIQSDQEAALQFDAWLHDQDLLVDAAQIERRHIEAWLAHLLGTLVAVDRGGPVPVAAPVLRWLEEDDELRSARWPRCARRRCLSSRSPY